MGDEIKHISVECIFKNVQNVSNKPHLVFSALSTGVSNNREAEIYIFVSLKPRLSACSRLYLAALEATIMWFMRVQKLATFPMSCLIW